MKSKSLISNYIFNTLYTTLNIIFPLITMPYISRVLLADGVGKVSFAENIVQYFVLFASLGIPNYGVREIAKVHTSLQNRSKVFSEIFIINFIASVCSSLVFYSVISTMPAFKDNAVLLSISGMTICLNIFNVDWFYKGMEEYRYITVRSAIIKVLSLVSMLIFVRDIDDYFIYAFIHCMATAGNYIFNIIHIRKYVKFEFNNLKLKKHLKPIFILLSTQIAVSLYVQLDTTMLGFMCGDVYVGYYSNVVRMIRIIVNVTTSLSAILLPRLSFYLEEGRIEELKALVEKTLKIIILLSVPCTVGVLLLSDSMVMVLFGENFIPSITTMKILSFLIIILGVGNLFGTQLLMIFGQEKRLLRSVIIGAVTNIILNSILMINYKHNGAAFASVFAETCVTISQIILCRKFIVVKLERRFCINITASVLAMLGFIMIINIFSINDLLKLVVSIPIGAAIYFVMNIVLKNEVVIEIADTAYKKIRRK